MAKIRTYVDSGMLLFAARGSSELSAAAMAILDDPDRLFVSSDFVRLEVLPKAIYHKKFDEANFYNVFFEMAQTTVQSTKHLIAAAQTEAELVGLSAVDALHIAAAKQAKCHEFITVEKSTKPMFRVQGIAVRSLRG